MVDHLDRRCSCFINNNSSSSPTSKTLPAMGVGRGLRTSYSLPPKKTVPTVCPRIDHTATKLPRPYLITIDHTATKLPRPYLITIDHTATKLARPYLITIDHTATKLPRPYLITIDHTATKLPRPYLITIDHTATKLPRPYLITIDHTATKLPRPYLITTNLSKPWSCGRQNLTLRRFYNRGNSHKPSV